MKETRQAQQTHGSRVVTLHATIPMQDLPFTEQQEDALSSPYQLRSLADVVLQRCNEHSAPGPAAALTVVGSSLRSHRIEPTTHEASMAFKDTTASTFHESGGATNFIPPLSGLHAFELVGDDLLNATAASLFSATTDVPTLLKTIPGSHYVETGDAVDTANTMETKTSGASFGTHGHDDPAAQRQHQLGYQRFDPHGTSELTDNGKIGTVRQRPQWNVEMKWALEMLATIDDAKLNTTPTNGAARCSHPLMDHCVTRLLQLAIPPPLSAAAAVSSQSSLPPVATVPKRAQSPVYNRLEYLTLLLDMMQRYASSPSLNAMALYLVYCDVATIRRRHGHEREDRRRNRYYRRQWHRIWQDLGSAVVSVMERFADSSSLQELAMNVLLACTIHRPASVLRALPSDDVDADWSVGHATSTSATHWSRSLMVWNEDFWFDATYTICHAAAHHAVQCGRVALASLTLLACLSEHDLLRAIVWTFQSAFSSSASANGTVQVPTMVATILNVMERHSHCASIQCQAMATLSWLIYHPLDSMRSTVSTWVQSARDWLGDVQDIVKAVNKSMRIHNATSAGVFGHGVCLLAAIPPTAITDETEGDIVLHNNLFGTVVEGMVKYSHVLKIQVSCLWWMKQWYASQLSEHTLTPRDQQGNLDRLVSLVSHIIGTMHEHRNDAQLQMLACRILTSVTAGSLNDDIFGDSFWMPRIPQGGETSQVSWTVLDTILLIWRLHALNPTVAGEAAWLFHVFLLRTSGAATEHGVNNIALRAFGGGVDLVDEIGLGFRWNDDISQG
jgi:hypothetical protein